MATTTTTIHDLYRAALAADDAYSAILTEHAASRWESFTTRAARSARAQYLIKQAYSAKVSADKAYSEACEAARVGY